MCEKTSYRVGNARPFNPKLTVLDMRVMNGCGIIVLQFTMMIPRFFNVLLNHIHHIPFLSILNYRQPYDATA
jgi:hypothetical protein